jgi:hypothetical protein
LQAIEQAGGDFRVEPSHHPEIDLRSFGDGTKDQIKKLSKAKALNFEGLRWATQRGVLRFGRLFGCESYMVTDQTQGVTMVRRIDGEPYPPEAGEEDTGLLSLEDVDLKVLQWPLGIKESEPYPAIVLLQTWQDFIDAHYDILWEQASHHSRCDVKCAPVAMWNYDHKIAQEALEYFREKTVRIVPHNNEDGQRIAKIWANQIYKAGAKKVDFLNLHGLVMADGRPVTTLRDCSNLSDESFRSNQKVMSRRFPNG